MNPIRDPKRTNVKAKSVIFDDDDVGRYAEPGSIETQQTRILLACPGCGHVSGMSVGDPKPQQSPSWLVGGTGLEDVTGLTLHPSINCTGCCGWHGWLTDGVFVSC